MHVIKSHDNGFFFQRRCMRRKLSINCQRDDIHMFSKHSPARARAPDIRIAHTSVAGRPCAVRCAFVTRDTHAHSRANDDYCRCINVMCSIAMETSSSKNCIVSALCSQFRSNNTIYLDSFRVFFFSY